MSCSDHPDKSRSVLILIKSKQALASLTLFSRINILSSLSLIRWRYNTSIDAYFCCARVNLFDPQSDVCSNLALDHHVFQACNDSNVDKVIFSSTACVYPTKLQDTIGSDYKLKEQDADPTNLDTFMSADIEYGWEKLMSEMQLNAFKKQYGLKGCPVRFVTAYGPRENETHAIIALIYKALAKMDPYQIWGDGNQERDFTYVEDIVDGTILSAEKITDGTPINLGTGQRYKMIDVVNLIFKIIGWKPQNFEFDTSKPVSYTHLTLQTNREV